MHLKKFEVGLSARFLYVLVSPIRVGMISYKVVLTFLIITASIAKAAASPGNDDNVDQPLRTSSNLQFEEKPRWDFYLEKPTVCYESDADEYVGLTWKSYFFLRFDLRKWGNGACTGQMFRSIARYCEAVPVFAESFARVARVEIMQLLTAASFVDGDHCLMTFATFKGMDCVQKALNCFRPIGVEEVKCVSGVFSSCFEPLSRKRRDGSTD